MNYLQTFTDAWSMGVGWMVTAFDAVFTVLIFVIAAILPFVLVIVGLIFIALCISVAVDTHKDNVKKRKEHDEKMKEMESERVQG